MEKFTALALIATIVFFVLSMLLYILCLIDEKKPLSYFDLLRLSRFGNNLAKVSWVLWNISIGFSLLTAIFSLTKFFI